MRPGTSEHGLRTGPASVREDLLTDGAAASGGAVEDVVQGGGLQGPRPQDVDDLPLHVGHRGRVGVADDHVLGQERLPGVGEQLVFGQSREELPKLPKPQHHRAEPGSRCHRRRRVGLGGVEHPVLVNADEHWVTEDCHVRRGRRRSANGMPSVRRPFQGAAIGGLGGGDLDGAAADIPRAGDLTRWPPVISRAERVLGGSWRGASGCVC